MNTSSAVCQEPFGPESGRSAENHSLKPSRSGRRCVYLITLLEMLRHCNEHGHGHTHRVLCSLLYLHSNHSYAVSRSSVSTQRNTWNILCLSHLRAAKTSWDVCWRKPGSVTRQRSVRPSAHTPHTHTLLESVPLPSSPVPLPAAGLTAQRKQGECTEPLAKLQKKNQELQRHLEKACRQLQKSVREHKSTLQKMKGVKILNVRHYGDTFSDTSQLIKYYSL